MFDPIGQATGETDLQFHEGDRLLDPAPMRLETGYERNDDGVLHIACRSDMLGCTGEMFDWWLRSKPRTERYAWWHPVDHRSSEWLEGRPGDYVGSIHRVEESFAGLPAVRLLIQFRAPSEFLHADRYRSALDRGEVSAAACAIVAAGWDAARLPDGRLVGSRLLHVVRDTSWGCALRSHFFLGHDLAASGAGPEAVQRAIPDELGPALLAHSYDESRFLSRFLPALFVAENRAARPVELPW